MRELGPLAFHDRPHLIGDCRYALAHLIGDCRYALAPASQLLFRCNPNLGIFKDGQERSAAAVCERIRPALAIVRDESRMAMDWIAWSMMPTEPWSMPVATQNKITRSCALSFVVGFSMVWARRQLWAKEAIAASSPLRGSVSRQRQFHEPPS